MSKVFLFHKDHPNGKMFDQVYADKHEAELMLEGWVDSPKDFREAQAKAPDFTPEQVRRMGNEDLVSLVKSMGFHVLTNDQLEAEVQKRVSQIVYREQPRAADPTAEVEKDPQVHMPTERELTDTKLRERALPQAPVYNEPEADGGVTHTPEDELQGQQERLSKDVSAEELSLAFEEDAEGLTKSELQRVADYRKLAYTTRMTKDDLIAAIIEAGA